jgi:hypothetical protein
MSQSIEKNRNVFSFNNGLYVTMIKDDDHGYVDEWIPYIDAANMISLPHASKRMRSELTSCNCFPFDFDISTRPRPNEPNYSYNNWFNIIVDKCPTFKFLMDNQKWSMDVQRWLCIMIGRCLHNVNDLDSWQVVPFLLGPAGTGKSTILSSIVKRFYKRGDVGIMSNNIDKRFDRGLSEISNKFLFIAPEIQGNFNLPYEEFQCIVSGETIMVNAIQARGVIWNVPGMLAGNEIPKYLNKSASIESGNGFEISRRLVVFRLDEKVKIASGWNFSKILEEEIGHILHACNRGYLEAANLYGHCGDIWEVVPRDLVNWRHEKPA